VKAKDRGAPEPTYIDSPEIREIFADQLERLFLDGGVVRMEFTVLRTDFAKPGPGQPVVEPKRWSHTACRLVLSMRGVADMLNKMQELQGLLVQQGVLQAHPREPVGQAAPSGRSLDPGIGAGG
jgi:hypothetical protein